MVVDVGGGRGDLAVRIVRWARRAGRPVRVIVLDHDATTLALARRRTARYSEIALVRADATALPLRAGAVDVAVAALTLHHLTPDEATAALTAMTAAARVVVVNDLLRTPVALALVWLATRALRLHPVSRHDGPLSVRRAYSADELTALGRRSGRAVRGQLVPVARPAGGRGRMSTTQTDVVVVGAGPAGAATAILLAEHGLDVVVLDRGSLPRPKICGEYLSPEAGRVLDRLGVLKAVDAAGAAAIHGMRITAPDGTAVTGHYRDVGAVAAVPASRDGRGPRDPRRRAGRPRARTAAGPSRAVRVSSTCCSEHDVVRGVRFTDRDAASTICARGSSWAPTGAPRWWPSGSACRRPHALRRMALVTYVSGLENCQRPRRDLRGSTGLRDPQPDRARPREPRPRRAAGSRRTLERPAGRLHGRARPTAAAPGPSALAGAARVAPIRALGPLAHRAEPPKAAGVLLVGDASGFYDPFTGEGVFTALRSAELAVTTIVRALGSGDVSARALAGYERARREIFSGKERVTRALQFLIRHRRLANLACRALARRRRRARHAARGVLATTCRRAPSSARCAADDLAAAHGAARPKTSSSGTAANPAGSVNSASGISRRSTRATAVPGVAPPPWNTTFSGHPSE